MGELACVAPNVWVSIGVGLGVEVKDTVRKKDFAPSVPARSQGYSLVSRRVLIHPPFFF